MPHIKRASIAIVENEVLPLALALYQKRGAVRAVKEEVLRAPEKQERDKRSHSKPRLCTI